MAAARRRMSLQIADASSLWQRRTHAWEVFAASRCVPGGGVEMLRALVVGVVSAWDCPPRCSVLVCGVA